MENRFINYYEDNLDNFDYKKIGERIKSLRKRLEITQQQLANRVFKTESSIRKYEKGLVTIPFSVLLDLGYALETTVFYILCLDDLPPENMYDLVVDYKIPPWKILGVDYVMFLENIEKPNLYDEYRKKMGKSYLDLYIDIAKKTANENIKITIEHDDMKNKTLNTISDHLNFLNEKGQKKAIELTEILTKVPDYQNNFFSTIDDEDFKNK